MTARRLVAGMAIVLGLHGSVNAAMYIINNPAEKINNPADKMYNPATQVNNPAGNIYNPATRMNNPDPLSPPTQPAPRQTAPEAPAVKTVTPVKAQPQPVRPAVPQKNYYFKTSKEYIAAAKKAFVKDDYMELISIADDALRRITAGTLKTSKVTKKKFIKYKELGYGLLEDEKE